MNVTNKKFGAEQFFSQNERLKNNFFKNPITKNPSEIFTELGVEFVWEGNRALLKSQSAIEEVRRLEWELEKQNNVKLFKGVGIEEIKIIGEKFRLNREVFDYLVLATGGMFRLGSEKKKNQIYGLVTDLEHTITATNPTLSALEIKHNPFEDLAGTSFKGILKDLKLGIEICDDILFTHKGISGPAVLDFTSYLKSSNFEICFLADSKEQDFQNKIKKLRDGKEKISSFLNSILPKKLTTTLLEEVQISKEGNFSELSKVKEKKLQELIFHFPVSLAKKMGYQFSWTTKGGVDLKEVNLNSLESKIHKNLFFAGELIDIDGLCGGYNISFAAICSKIISNNILKQ